MISRNLSITSLVNSIKADIQTESVLEAYPGSLIYTQAQASDQLLILLEGSIRLIDKKKPFGSLTLAKVDAPDVLGIHQKLSIPSPYEARAISECQYLLIKSSELKELQSKVINEALLDNIQSSECGDIFSSICSIYPEFKCYAQNAEQVKKACKICKYTDYNSNDSLLYLDESKHGFHYGQLITPEICQAFFTPDDWPRIATISQGSDTESTRLASKIRIISPNTPREVGDIEFDDLPITPEFATEKDEAMSSEDGFRFIKATEKNNVFSSCIGMIVDYYQLPTRRDTIQKAGELIASSFESSLTNSKGRKSHSLPWLDKLIGILDELGLAVRRVKVQPDNPFRIPTPAIWMNAEGKCILITRAEAKNLQTIDPEQSRTKWGFKQAKQYFEEQNEIISVDIGLHTPKKRFGISWLAPYIKRYRIQLIEVFSASFLNQLFALATPLLFQQIIDRVISKGAFDALGPLVILMLTFALLETTFSTLRTFQFVEISNRIDISIGSAIVSRLLRLNARFFDRRPVGELASRLGELENIRRFLTGTALTVVLDAFFALLYFGVMFFYSPLLTGVILLTLPFLFGITIGVTPITQRLIRARAEAASKTQSLLVEILGGIQTVKLQNAEVSARRRWEDRHLNSINQGFKAVLANTSSSNALQLINKLSSILIIGCGAWLVLRNELTLGQLIAFRIISNYVTQPMLRLASTWQSFQELLLSLERVGDVVNQPLEISEEEETNITMPLLEGEIEIKSLGYTYASTSQPVLSSVSLNIPAGSFVGLVGQSGCGKSTLLKMVPRLYRPTSGKILIDNLDISKVDLYSLRKQIGFVPQDCLLFEGNIFSNIALGDPHAESEKIIEMAKIACAHEFIMELPYGYSTPVGEKGSGLSGGQRQRIALARMLLENPRMIVLDEATSALDVNTERQVVNNLKSYLTGRTCLMITHRLSTLIEADQIIVMHAGRVDEMGTHSELMKLKGRYFALYQSQFGET